MIILSIIIIIDTCTCTWNKTLQNGPGKGFADQVDPHFVFKTFFKFKKYQCLLQNTSIIMFVSQIICSEIEFISYL